MNVNEAKRLATKWVQAFSEDHFSFHSAYLAGSIVDRAEEESLSKSSDLDVLVILNQQAIPLKPGKIRYQNVLLDVTYLSWSDYDDIEKVLSSYHLANTLKTNTILVDPSGELQHLQQTIASQFAQKEWVLARCEDALQRIENNLNSLSQKNAWADQVMAWLFGTGVMCHVLLVAGLKNPTIRLRYLATRKLLIAYHHEDVYEDLLELLGCKELRPERMPIHLNELKKTFDAAVAVSKTPFFFSTDITEEARALAIKGSCELIAEGNHREAVFWMLTTFARCHQIFNADAPELSETHQVAFQVFLEDIGIRKYQDLEERAVKVRQYFPHLRKVALNIIGENPEVIK